MSTSKKHTEKVEYSFTLPEPATLTEMMIEYFGPGAGVSYHGLTPDLTTHTRDKALKNFKITPEPKKGETVTVHLGLGGMKRPVLITSDSETITHAMLAEFADLHEAWTAIPFAVSAYDNTIVVDRYSDEDGDPDDWRVLEEVATILGDGISDWTYCSDPMDDEWYIGSVEGFQNEAESDSERAQYSSSFKEVKEAKLTINPIYTEETSSKLQEFRRKAEQALKDDVIAENQVRNFLLILNGDEEDQSAPGLLDTEDPDVKAFIAK